MGRAEWKWTEGRGGQSFLRSMQTGTPEKVCNEVVSPVDSMPKPKDNLLFQDGPDLFGPLLSDNIAQHRLVVLKLASLADAPLQSGSSQRVPSTSGGVKCYPSFGRGIEQAHLFEDVQDAGGI